MITEKQHKERIALTFDLVKAISKIRRKEKDIEKIRFNYRLTPHHIKKYANLRGRHILNLVDDKQKDLNKDIVELNNKLLSLIE